MFGALLGVLIGTAVFAGFFWSVAQSFRQEGGLAWAHRGLLALCIAGMATISLTLPTLALIVGTALVITAIAAIILERGWNRLLPLTQLAFGVALGLALPFG